MLLNKFKITTKKYRNAKMKFLYVNNFRGFLNTFIPIKDVNFLIGENSTGKTSILSLVKILSSDTFLFDFNFVLDELELGNFEDMVSHNSGNKNIFSVGLCESTHNESDGPKRTMVLVTYKNSQDRPVAETASFLSPIGLIHLRIMKDSIKFRLDKSFTMQNSENISKEDLFCAGALAHKRSSRDFKKLPPEIREFPQVPYSIVIRFLVSYFTPEKDKKKKLSRNLDEQFTLPEVIWIAPIREKPKRTYDQYWLNYSPEGTHTPYLLNDFLGDRRGKPKSKILLKMLEDFGLESDLFKTIKVKRFGPRKTAPFEIDVVLNVEPLKISSVGYGVAQVLPIVVECILRPKGIAFAIQQPEVHLHPKAQASLGDFIFSLANLEGKVFFIETHSDFIIDRFRRNQKNDKNTSAQVLFFERTDQGNRVHAICINKDGQYEDNQPENFRDFFVKEELEMLNF
jgi:predicted ATPase